MDQENKDNNNKRNPFINLDPLHREEEQKDILVEFQKLISQIKEKQKLIEIQKIVTRQLNSM